MRKLRLSKIPINSTMDEEAEADKALQYALRFLGYRGRSVQEMRRKLASRGVSEAATAQVLQRLLQLELLNDRDFAQSWIESRRGYGAVRLRKELQQKGISRELVEAIMTTGISADEEYQAAWLVAVRSLRGATESPGPELLIKIRRLLLRRGFRYETINRVCARLNDSSSVEEDWQE